MNWISKNKQWLFSGAGVTIILLVSGFLYHTLGPRAFSTPPARETVPPVRPEPDTFTRPSPEEIRKQLEALPPFQQRTAAETYKGLQVFWPATFETIEESKPDKWIVMLRYRSLTAKESREIIACIDVDVEANPRLKFAHSGDAVNVHGIIHAVSLVGLWLKDVSIDFK